MKKSTKHHILVSFFIITLLALFFTVYIMDNKYTNLQPIGSDGELAFTDEDLENPIFLIDGWMLSVDGNEETETFIGQYSNFKYAPGGTSPFGKATYRLNLKYLDLPENGRILSMFLPEIFTDYKVYVNGDLLAERGTSHIINFNMTKNTEILIETENHSHYYSGIYYPPSFGTAETIDNIHVSRIFVYDFVIIYGLIVAGFSLILYIWKGREKIFIHFAFMCFWGVVSCLHPIIWQCNLSSPLFYALENASGILTIAETLAITSFVSGFNNKKHIIAAHISLLLIAAFEFVAVIFIIPAHPEFIEINAYFIAVVLIICWIILSVISGIAFAHSKESIRIYVLLGSCTVGLSSIWNILDNNQFEPVYTMWQAEWAIFINIIIFTAVIILHNGKILEENRMLNEHLEELVVQRSAELTTIIDERKRFFSDMAHNLKSPIATIHGFISLIQQHKVGLDDELCGYISIIKSENLEMQRRVQALNEINAFDRIEGSMTLISINALLDEVETTNSAGAEVNGIYLTINRLKEDAFVTAQKEKLLIMFENLIINALSFTPPEGNIDITAAAEKDYVVFTVKDTGVGIPPETLPHIFERFYSERSTDDGSGLGLYIVKLTVDELNGTIICSSEVNKGTTFVIRLPRAD